jgi:hypothetical protein
VCLWNIHGAAITKLKTHEHLLDLFQHVDVVALTETHHFPSDTFPVLPGFCYFDVAKPVTPQGVVQKHSGGIAVLVRETWANSTLFRRLQGMGLGFGAFGQCFPKAFVLVHSICCSTRLTICGQQPI